MIWGALLVPLLLLAGCRAEAPDGPRRVALLPFEFQGSAAEHRWLADALETAAAEQMRGAPNVIPMRAIDVGSATAQGATEVLRGIVSGSPDSIRVTLYRERPNLHELRVLGDGGAGPTSLAGAMATLRASLEQAGVAGAALSTSSPEAFALYGRSLRATDAAGGIALLEQAVATDPRFTSASLRLATLWQRTGQGDRAMAEAERLLAALPDERKLERAYAALQVASLRGDAAGVESALATVVEFSPYDLETANRLAGLYQQRRHYAEAAKVLRKVVEADAGNAGLWNQIAYAEAFSGHRAGAMEALGQYRKLVPDDPNVDDTTGDVLYFFAAFSEAADAYENAYRRNPQWQAGYPLFKAAWARIYSGDLEAADAAMEQYVALIRPANKPLAEFRAAQWHFLRGRREEARSSLNAILGQSELARPYRSLVASQLYMWDLAEGRLAQLVADFQARKPRYGSEVVPAVAALLQGTRPGQTPAQRAQAMAAATGGTVSNALVAAATFLDARARPPLRAEAMQALSIADRSTPEAQGMFTHAVAAWGFLERGEPGEAALLFARRIPPVADDDGLLWPLIFPESLAWELDAWKQAQQQPAVPAMPKLAEQLLPQPRGR